MRRCNRQDSNARKHQTAGKLHRQTELLRKVLTVVLNHMCPTKPRRQDLEWDWSAECDHVFGYYYHIVYRRSADLGKVNVDMVRVFMRENESRSKNDSQQHLTRICFPYPGISTIAKHVEQSSNNGLSFQHFCTFFLTIVKP